MEVLIADVGRALETMARDALLSPKLLAVREEALRTLSAYSNKDANYKPAEPKTGGDDYNRYVEIDLTSDEAARLGAKGSRISVFDLWAVVKEETTLPEANQKKGLALLLLEQGVKHYDAFTNAIAEYNKATRAYDILAKPIEPLPEDAALLQRGTQILDGLKKLSPFTSILLAEKERADLTSGAFDQISGNQFSSAEQNYRDYINACVGHSYKQTAAVPFKAVFDPQLIDRVETLMRVDSTASWLLDHIKKGHVPVVLHEYNVPPGFPAISERGALIEQAALSPLAFARKPYTHVEYIRLFLNDATDLDHACTLAHEARHQWQQQVITVQERLAALPFDNLVLGMIYEADTHGITGKIQWALSEKIGSVAAGLHTQDHIEFGRNFARPIYAELSRAAKLKKSIQAGFLTFLEKEFAQPAYLNVFIERYLGRPSVPGGDMDVYRRQIEDCAFLKPQFLKRITEVNAGLSYLDDEGVALVIKLFKDKLPQAISQYRPPAPGATFQL
ncbi:MAG: hypothetical protein M3N08_06730 [Pseudomonadota bacterium]|nr:hypothetical protein [Pseudomonadota bacterium]